MSQQDPWATSARATGVAGLVGIVLVFAPIIAMSSLGEPAFDATREEAAAFFRNTAESSWADAAGTVALLGLVALMWFIVGFCLLLRRAEGEPPWRSTVALVFGALFAAYLLTEASWEAAGNRGADLDPGLAHFAFDTGNIGFANAWVSMGSFAAFSRLGGPQNRCLQAMVGLAHGGQWRRVGTEPVCLDDERVAGALRTLLDLGHRSVHPTPQETSMTIVAPGGVGLRVAAVGRRPVLPADHRRCSGG